jgi:anti-sigma B factor antagonist
MLPTPDTTPEVLRPSGELNAVTSPALRAQLLERLNNGVSSLLVDLSAVPFIDSSGLSALVGGLKVAKLKGASLVLFGLQDQARQIFAITQADGLFDIVPSEQAALAFLSPPE